MIILFRQVSDDFRSREDRRRRIDKKRNVYFILVGSFLGQFVDLMTGEDPVKIREDGGKTGKQETVWGNATRGQF